MKLLNSIWFLSLLCVGSLQASNELFEEANAAYEEGDFEQAIEKYKLVLDENPTSAEVNYNLATSYYQINELGKSILYFEKTLRWNPGNAAAKHNLQLAYLKSEHEIEPLPQLFFVEWWQQLISFNSANVWAKWGVLFAWLSLACFILYKRNKKRIFKSLGRLTITACLFLVFLAYQKNQFDSTHSHAIVISEEVSMKETPNQSADEVQKAYEGLKVELMDSVDQWTKVKLQDETTAWIKTNSLAKI